MEFQVVIPVLIAFAISVILGTCHYSFSQETEDGTDRENRRRTVSSEKSGDSYYGRCDFSDMPQL